MRSRQPLCDVTYRRPHIGGAAATVLVEESAAAAIIVDCEVVATIVGFGVAAPSTLDFDVAGTIVDC